MVIVVEAAVLAVTSTTIPFDQTIGATVGTIWYLDFYIQGVLYRYGCSLYTDHNFNIARPYFRSSSSSSSSHIFFYYQMSDHLRCLFRSKEIGSANTESGGLRVESSVN